MREQLDRIVSDPAKLHALVYVFEDSTGRLTGSIVARPVVSKSAALLAIKLTERLAASAFMPIFSGDVGQGKFARPNLGPSIP